MTPYCARWVLQSAFRKTGEIDRVMVEVRKFRGHQAEEKKKDLESARTRVEWAIERATKVLLDAGEAQA